MRNSRFGPWLVVIIGVILTIIESVLIVYFVMNPVEQQISVAQALYQANIDEGTPAIVNKDTADLDLAKKLLVTTQNQWDVKQRALMPPYDVSNRYLAWTQISHELSENLGPSVERWIAHSGVDPLSHVTIQAPVASPNLITGDTLTIPISSGGSMSVGGDFRTILQHIVKWNDFNRLVLVDKLQLHGNSPYMKGDYTAKIFIFPQNADKVDKAVGPAAGGASAAAPGRPGL